MNLRRTSAPYRTVLRSRIALLADQGTSNHEIARTLGCALQTVKTWRKRFVRDRLAALVDRPRSGRPRQFPARTLATLKAIACELPAERGLPLSRFSLSEIHSVLRKERLKPLPSRTTVWRVLHQDGIRPWFYRTWIHKRAPDFLERAGPILDLYEGRWENCPLGPNDQVICADEKTGIQLLRRKVPTRAPRPREPGKVEFEYSRQGTLCFQGALDVRHGRVFGNFPERNTAEAFRAFVTTVMEEEPFATAPRVFWITDNGAAHHPKTFGTWLTGTYSQARAVHTPVHASWVDQEELFLAILTKKALTPRDFRSREEAEARIRGFLARWNRHPRPFRWTYTRDDLRSDLKRWSEEESKNPAPVRPEG
ncbi:MAG TPA: IS630 family transposase [Thermoplasmata archaeon]|nr:IS630 family transposase [Thermoplasmata archaeon]